MLAFRRQSPPDEQGFVKNGCTYISPGSTATRAAAGILSCAQLSLRPAAATYSTDCDTEANTYLHCAQPFGGWPGLAGAIQGPDCGHFCRPDL